MTARFGDPEHTSILLEQGGAALTVPVDPRNRDYAALIAAGQPIAPYAPPPPTAEDVRAEASRRIQALVGARDARHLEIVVANGSREAIRLLRAKADRAWTAEEAARAAALEAIDQAIEAIRAASNAMEAAPPADFTADHRWP
jgi:hypothetical protein